MPDRFDGGALSAPADMIVLQNGRKYQGTLVKGDAEAISFRVDGETRTYSKEEVVHVRLQKERRWADAETVSELEDEVLQGALQVDVEPFRRSGAGAATLLDRRAVTLHSDATWTLRRRTIVRILNEHGQSETIREIRFDRDAETARILHGLSVRPDGRLVHLRDTAVQTEFPYQAVPRYNRVAVWRFALPEGKPGTTVDAANEVQRKRPLFGCPFHASYQLGGLRRPGERHGLPSRIAEQNAEPSPGSAHGPYIPVVRMASCSHRQNGSLVLDTAARTRRRGRIRAGPAAVRRAWTACRPRRFQAVSRTWG